ncbi:MAG: type I-U CRISPR-associated protein Cas7 [Anaerolineaceae bacterium]|nr:MAG: type I-U CRISPR-associated protein Cas7 [Anaerolineaceae bacterium]
MNEPALNASELLNGTQNRLVIQATLQPVAGKTRFQPAGFPEIGHVIYKAPDGKKVCIVDSAASMANHLETVCVNPFDLSMVSELEGLPYLQCVTGDNKDEVVVTSLSEGHRLASDYFLKGKRLKGDTLDTKLFGDFLRDDEFQLRNLDKKTHPLPSQWWDVFRTIFRYDPNSLVHGILFPALGIKLPRLLTATLDASGADRVATSGVKFDKLGKTTSGQPIFAKDEETATEIRATFVIDLSLIRSFGHGNDHGLNTAQKQFLLGFALWKIKKLLEKSFRFRSECDLELIGLKIDDETKDIPALAINIGDLISQSGFQDPRITKIYWTVDDLFKAAKDEPDGGNEDDSPASDENEQSDDND